MEDNIQSIPGYTCRPAGKGGMQVEEVSTYTCMPKPRDVDIQKGIVDFNGRKVEDKKDKNIKKDKPKTHKEKLMSHDLEVLKDLAATLNVDTANKDKETIIADILKVYEE